MVLTTLLAVGCADDTAQSASAAATAPSPPVPVAASLPPPPPPPEPSGPISVRVEFPDGRIIETDVSDADCPGTNTCDYYDVGPYIQAGLRKSGLSMHESCSGPAGNRACDIDAIDGLASSARGRWVMFRNGHRNPYPYNQVLHENQAQAIVFRFLSPSDRTP
jgi:hypothetical protein